MRSSPRSDEFNASLDESYNVYRRYQIAIHNDTPADCDKNSFLSFLVNSPLEVHWLFSVRYKCDLASSPSLLTAEISSSRVRLCEESVVNFVNLNKQVEG